MTELNPAFQDGKRADRVGGRRLRGEMDFVFSVKDECLSKLILFGEPALRTALHAYVEHFHGERNHQGKNNLLLFPWDEVPTTGPVRCRERLGGLLKFYHRAAA